MFHIQGRLNPTMAEDDQSDPFLWNEDRVVQEFCTPNRTWKAPPEKRLPDPAVLEARLRDCGVDGESLLTYGDEFGFDQLWGYLGVKKLPHQLSLKDAISQLRRRSQKYSEWKTQQLADSQLYGQEDEALAIKSESHQPARLQPAAQLSPTPASFTASSDGQAAPPRALSSSADVDRDPSALPEAARDLGSDQEVTEGPPSKKRRIAPITISNEPTGNTAFGVIPTEGDRFFQSTEETVLQTGDSGFLGTGILRLDQVLDPRGVEVEDPAQDEFGWVQCSIPFGRRIQVSARMKRFLRSSRVDTFKPIHDWEVDSIGSYAEQYDRESVDSDTWREYQQEEEELLAMKSREEAAKDLLLTKEQITDVVRNAIQDLESQWAAEKKPKQDLRAWRTWQDARRNPDRLALIVSVKRQLDRINDRIALYSGDIIRQSWSINEDVQRNVSGMLEASVFEKKRQDWLIDVLESPRQPAKPATLPRPTPKRVKPSTLEDDGEDLTSDSDDLNDFIEYDDNAIPLANDEMEVDSEPPLARATTPANPGCDGSVLVPDQAGPEDPSVGESRSDEQADMDLSTHPTPRKVKVEQVAVPTTPRRTRPSTPEVVELDVAPTPFKKLAQIPGLGDLESLEKIGEIGVEYWERERDAERLLVAVLCEWSRAKIVKILAIIKSHDHSEVWAKYISPTIDDPDSATADSVAFFLCRLFDIFVSKSARRAHAPNLRVITCKRLYREGHLFADFCAYLRSILPLFLGAVPHTPSRNAPKPSQEEPLSTQESCEIRDPANDGSSSDGLSSDGMAVPSAKKRRQRKRRDKVAEKIRIDILKTNEEQSQRARQLRERIAEQGSVSSKQSRLIVNESKESDDQALIYINDHIGSRIKDHQVEGVRFMWNQVVVHSTVRQGCLLAHTMGLGKTMQVITLLVVIAESSASGDESVRSQIPESLRESKTLILCPASLVDNWYEEIRLWAPENVLGPVHRMHATLTPAIRLATIRAWARDGGVLIIGYTMFASLVRDDVGDVATQLLETPNLVIGDEAHYMKNPESQRHQAAANFKTMSRIAMTGSPLTNNVMDYYSMINWVAPNYLADIAEFRQRFSNPIKEGLYVDSEPQQKRKARKMLQVLKATVDPKVHRRDIEVLFNELPRKKEFIITLPLTKHQWRLYKTYIELVTDPSRELITGNARAWSLVAKLGLVLAHPFIFKTVAEAQKAKRNGFKPKASISVNGQKSEENGEEEMPQDVLHELLATVAVREIEDYALSNKILVLLRILDECRKVEDKVLVFSRSIPTLDYIENICKRRRVVYQRLDGQTPMATRQDAIKRFNSKGGSEVYLVSTTAGGVGLNIYGANRVVIFDFKYTPADEQQAIGRAYRLGQTKPVYVYWLTIGGTFEDTIHNNAVFKTQLASRVVDKKNPDPWSKRFAEYFAMPRELDQDDLSGAEGQDQVLDALLKNQDIRKHIRKITSTETFEKEETYELTAEEKKEVEDDVKLELLRSQDPEKFKSLERDRFLQSRMPRVPPAASLYQPRPAGPADGESHAAPHCISNRPSRMVRIKVPEHLRDKRKLGPPAPVVVPGAPSSQHGTLLSQQDTNRAQHQILTLTSDPALVSPHDPFTLRQANSTAAIAQSLPAQVSPVTGQQATGQHILPSTQSALGNNPLSNNPLGNTLTQIPKPAVPHPILAMGTQFKVPQAQPPPAPPSGPSILSSPNTASLIATETLDFGLPELLEVHGTLCSEGRHVRHHPNELISRVKDVLTRNRIERLPMMDKLQNMKKFARNRRFAEAMLSGYLEPEQIASLTRLDMEKISASLSGMAEGEFKQRVWTTKANLSVCTGTKST